MKAKVILYGWAFSWIFLFAGVGTMEGGNDLLGLSLLAVWLGFSIALLNNEKECLDELDRLKREG